MLNRLSVILSYTVLQEIKECDALAFGAGIDHGIIHTDHRSGNGASRSERRAQIGTSQIRNDLFKSPKDEHLVLHDGRADCTAKLVAPKVLEWFSIRCVRRQ